MRAFRAAAEEAKLKKFLLATAAIVFAGSAYAGDMPRRYNSPQVYQNLFNWTGLYAGLHGGLGWGDANGADLSGWALGAQIGYNYQLPSNIVVGVEADLSLTDIDGVTSGGVFTTDYTGSVRGRFGYAFDRVMLYATAGFAFAGGEFAVGALASDRTHYGYAIGAGIEGMISPNMSVRLEYIYSDFGRRTYTTIGGPVGVGIDTSVLRAGVNYRF